MRAKLKRECAAAIAAPAMIKPRAMIGLNDKEVGEIAGPAAFGELALMYNSPRAATITC